MAALFLIMSEDLILSFLALLDPGLGSSGADGLD